ncbi:MAG: NADH-quinone oxidoreductase subunit L [Verrucomicrobiota bacterium]
MDTGTLLLLLTLLIPLASAAIILLFLRSKGLLASVVSVGAAAALLVTSLMAIFSAGTFETPSLTWLQLGDFELSFGFLFDHAAATMLFVVAFVGFLIHVFSLGYMEKDSAKARYFGGLSIFMFSMLGIVLADNLLMIFVFWELVGFSSYMLIGHYLHTDEARQAAKKAFIVNRVGDLGFLIGIAMCYWHFSGVTDNPLSLSEIAAAVGANPSLVSWGLALLLACGFIGKSAQFPLHVWLPDAMAGPTPVSALIHAATMVAAGVYFLIRIVFLFPPEALQVIAWLGTAMAVYAGVVAYGQSDIKRILAYSTLSQLGYMAAAFGLGMPGLALFHLATHAFFKALLFLAAGSVIHGCHHEQDIFKMGGLLKKMPLTALTFAIGTASLAGVYFTAGYWSKDSILLAAFADNQPVFWLLMLGAFLTAGYMGRLFWIAFLGEPKSEHAKHAHESPLVMTVPLILLALLALVGGFYKLWPEALNAAFYHDVKLVHDHHSAYHAGYWPILVLGSLAWIVGLGLSYWFYRPGAKEDRLEQSAPGLFGVLRSRLYFDEAYNWYVKKVQQRFADLINLLDMLLIQGLLVRGAAGVAALLGIFGRMLHVGSIHGYVYWFLIGLLVFGGYAVGWIG